MILSGIRLYTWLDVEEALLRLQEEGGGWPEWLLGARAYWDSLTLKIEPGHLDDAKGWLRAQFEPRVAEPREPLFHALAIALESLQRGNRLLPVIFEETSDRPPKQRLVPSLSRPALLQPGAVDKLAPPPLPDDGPELFAFHSFKGGVGRTVHAIALAKAMALSGHRVLLVDGDFEAPGITALLATRRPSLPVSFSDLLALAHGDPDPRAEESIKLVADRLRDVVLDGIQVLPAFRSFHRFHALEIRPEHLLQGPGDPFVLTSLLTSLGQELGVEAVIVDLRAGLSELAVGLLLDSRVHRVLMTTLAGQSLDGTVEVLELLARRAPSARDDDPLPVVILNQVPVEFQNGGPLAEAEERLLQAATNTVSGKEDGDILQGPTVFDKSLLTLPSSWDQVLTALRGSRIFDTVQPLVDLLPRGPSPLPVARSLETIAAHRSALSEASEKRIYAEAGKGEDFLSISPLRRLVMDHRQQLPVAVVVGAKGAGKTYTYLQIIRRNTWRQFTDAAGETPGIVDARICPMLEPQNLRGAAADLLRDARQQGASHLHLTSPLDSMAVRDRVREWLQQGLHEGQWRDRWLDLSAWGVGFRPEHPGAGRELPDHLANVGQQIIVLVDGLEDLFQNLPADKAQQKALRALLQEVPEWLRQQPSRSIGVIIFVRRDMVFNAVRQNPHQLLALYEPYALKWDMVEALRLVAWVCAKARVLPGVEDDKIRDMPEEGLTASLHTLWGKKLGRDKSREGRSAEWVIAALSDFRHQIQARDIVRFLSLAARASVGSPSQWSDRVLAPGAIKDAVAQCSIAKIDEIYQENTALGLVFDRLRSLSDDTRTIPFLVENVSLTADDIRLLEDNGVVVTEEGRYYMPEIFRRGLNFRLQAGARPKVLALARRRL